MAREAATKPKTSPLLGRLLRARREDLAWSLQRVAARLGTSVPYVSDVELARRSIAPPRLRQLAAVLRLDREATRRLFVLAGYLPPEVVRRVQGAPALWDVDPARVMAAVAEVMAGLERRRDHALLAKLRAAMAPVGW